MFQGIAAGRDHRRRPMDKALLGVEWRFLANASEDKPGFSTAWLQQKTLQRAADCRERDYTNGILAEFADEFGIAGVLSTHCVDSEDDPGDERDDVTRNMESCSLTAPDEPAASHSRAGSPEHLGIAVGEAPPLPAIFSALQKGGFDLEDLQVADDVPSELQTMPRILETKTNRSQRALPLEPAVPQPSSETQRETFEISAKARLKVGLSLAHLSPKRPKGTRTSNRPGGRAIDNRGVHASRENLGATRSRHATTCEPMSHAAPYGTAWYVNPQLWGLKSSPQLENKALDQEKDNTDGTKQLLSETKSMKDAIPGLFSAMRFVMYIRQQGVRMPAHLESTDRAMKADKARVRRIRKSQTAGEEDQDESEHDLPQEGEGQVAVPGTTPSKAWRARVNAAITLKKQGRRKEDDSARGKVRVIGTAVAKGRNRREGGVGAK